MKMGKFISTGAVVSLLVATHFGVASADQAIVNEQKKSNWHAEHEIEHSVGQLTFIGEQRIPNDEVYEETLVGGLSGIDYDPKTHKWIIISDDRSDKSPARFYTAKLKYDTNSFSSVKLNGMTEFKQSDGTTYPNKSDYAANKKGVVPDLESIRFDPTNDSIWYTVKATEVLPLIHSSLKLNETETTCLHSKFQRPLKSIKAMLIFRKASAIILPWKEAVSLLTENTILLLWKRRSIKTVTFQQSISVLIHASRSTIETATLLPNTLIRSTQSLHNRDQAKMLTMVSRKCLPLTTISSLLLNDRVYKPPTAVIPIIFGFIKWIPMRLQM